MQAREAAYVKQSICLWCNAECGVRVRVAAGKLVAVEPDPAWPRPSFSLAAGCVRRRAARDYVYHPARLNFPLKRVGARGEGRWQRLSWEDALDEIAAKVEEIRARYGPQAIAALGRKTRPQDVYRLRFLRSLGNDVADDVHSEDTLAARAITGRVPATTVRPTTACIVLLGAEPLVSRPLLAKGIIEALRRGARLIVINPRRTKSATRADLWLRLRPGTDVALLLGLAGVIIRERLYDAEFVAKYCRGFAELAAQVARYTPEQVAAVTGVPAEEIEAAARLYATSRPAVILPGRGVGGRRDTAHVLHCRWILAALTGNLDVAGGEEQHDPAEHEVLAEWAGGRGKEGFPEGWELWRTVLAEKPHSLRALFVQGRNPLVSMPHTGMVYEALKSLDLYVAMDLFPTPSTMLADYVLPGSCWLERPDVWLSTDDGVHLLVKPAVLPKSLPGEYEHYYDFDLWRGLGMRLGQAEQWPWATLEEEYAARLAAWNCHLEARQLVPIIPYREKKYLMDGFPTPTGKVELYSRVLAELGGGPLSPYGAPTATAANTNGYPLLLLNGGRICLFQRSDWRQIAFVRRRRPYPVVQLHRETARRLGIQEGDWVWLETKWGKVRQRAELVEGIDPGIVHAEFGWWLPEIPGEAPWLYGVWEVNVNACLGEGGPAGPVFCKVSKADPPVWPAGQEREVKAGRCGERPS